VHDQIVGGFWGRFRHLREVRKPFERIQEVHEAFGLLERTDVQFGDLPISNEGAVIVQASRRAGLAASGP
jgi:hypothetical protein